MQLILLGPPGAGKGTQGELLVEYFGVPKLSMGDILRTAVRDATVEGKEAKSYMDKGELVPDDLIIKIMRERLNNTDCKNGFVLDGFPRTTAQAEALDLLLRNIGLALDGVVEIKVSFNELLLRLIKRRSCRNCQAVYHLVFQAPKKEGKCDKCGGLLYQRDDDKEEVIQRRYEVYERETRPLSDYYSKCGLLKVIDGSGTAKEIFLLILSILGVKLSVL